jgi:AAA+ superfamily predicted ATPase
MPSEFERMPIIVPAADLQYDYEFLHPEMNHVILEYTEPTDDIESVKSVVRILVRNELPDALTISSYVEPTEKLPYNEIVERFMQIHSYHLSRLLPSEINPNSDLGLIFLKNTEGHSATINPDFVTDSWVIRSILDGFYDNAQNPEAIKNLFSSHAIILNGLIAAIESKEYPDPIEDKKDQEFLELRISASKKRESKIDYFDQFIGIPDAISELKKVVKLAHLDPELRREHDIELIQAILLSGPTGLGKTQLAISLADALEAEMQEVGLEQVGSVYTSQWATNIAEVFNNAIDAPHRVVLFFDEVDGLLTAGNEGTQRNINTIMKKKLEEIKNYPHVFVVMATNDESALPPEIRSKKRIPLTIRLQMPSDAERTAYLKHLLVEAPLASAGSSVERGLELMQADSVYDYEILAKETADMSPGEIEVAIKAIKQNRFLTEDIDSIGRPISQEEAISAFRQSRRTREA